jgi:MFS transporter, ACS family, allantoate permease
MAEKDVKTSDVPDVESQHRGEMFTTDVAAQFLANLSLNIRDQPIGPDEARRVLWKIDLIIIPLLGFSVMLSAIDKVIISNAAIYGMITDTHLVGNEYSWVGSIFYFGFLIAEWPANILIQKLPIRSFYGATVLGWAIFTFLTSATSNFGGLATVRFLSKPETIPMVVIQG